MLRDVPRALASPSSCVRILFQAMMGVSTAGDDLPDLASAQRPTRYVGIKAPMFRCELPRTPRLPLFSTLAHARFLYFRFPS